MWKPFTYPLVVGLLVCSAVGAAQTDVSGDWKGTWSDGKTKVRVVAHIKRAYDGYYFGRYENLDQNWSIPIERIEVDGDTVSFALKAANATYRGTFNAQQSHIQGTWFQGRELPLELTRSGLTQSSKPPTIAKLLRQQVEDMGPLLDMFVSIHPIPFLNRDKTYVAYEFHIVNLTDLELHLQRLEVMDGSNILSTLENDDLIRVLAPDEPETRDYRKLGPRKRAVAFLLIPLSSGASPVQLRHRVQVDGYIVEGGAAATSQSKPILIGAPLRGSTWIAAEGMSNESVSHHRHSAEKVAGKKLYGQRFAIDWSRLGDDGRQLFPKDNKSSNTYGNDVLAVADGVVVKTRDGIPDNTPGKIRYPFWYKLLVVNFLLYPFLQPLEPFEYAGNHVVLDLGGGQYAQYGHLQSGSLRAKTGDHVRRGQVLGLVGNSGNSTGPHLHFQIADGLSFIASEGLPYAIDSYETLAENAWEIRRSDMPMMGSRVRFLEGK